MTRSNKRAFVGQGIQGPWATSRARVNEQLQLLPEPENELQALRPEIERESRTPDR
jgi:hypothetical protein